VASGAQAAAGMEVQTLPQVETARQIQAAVAVAVAIRHTAVEATAVQVL